MKSIYAEHYGPETKIEAKVSGNWVPAVYISEDSRGILVKLPGSIVPDAIHPFPPKLIRPAHKSVERGIYND